MSHPTRNHIDAAHVCDKRAWVPLWQGTRLFGSFCLRTLCGEPQAAVSLYTPGAGRQPFPFHHATVCADVAVRELYTQ